MQPGDWLNAVTNLVIGVFLGLAIDGIVQLITTGFWPIAVLIPLLFAAVLFFSGLLDRLVDRIFPSGIRPARRPQPKRRTPLPERLSLPAGLVIGIALARLGLGGTLLGWVS